MDDNASDVKHELNRRDFDFVGVIDVNDMLLGIVAGRTDEGSIETYFRGFDF
jgi:hypothetical protein